MSTATASDELIAYVTAEYTRAVRCWDHATQRSIEEGAEKWGYAHLDLRSIYQTILAEQIDAEQRARRRYYASRRR